MILRDRKPTRPVTPSAAHAAVRPAVHASAADASASAAAQAALDVLASCVDAEDAHAAAMACVNELAARVPCERVSYGRRDARGRLRLVAMSNNARLAERSNLVRAIEAAMAEAAEQGTVIAVPPLDGQVVADQDHRALSQRHEQAPVMTVPVACDGEIAGAVTFERRVGAPFDDRAFAVAQMCAAATGPLLEYKLREAEPWYRRVRVALAGGVKGVFGPRHAGIKLAAAVAALLLGWLSLTNGAHRVTAEARLEGRIHRAVVAPMDGFVASAEARAGDRVARDAVLSRLDDRDLRVELNKWRAEADQLRKQYRGARAAHDRAESAIVRARIERAEAQIALIESQLARTELRAPIDGIVVAGDLSQLLGSPVARGDVLFEVAPLDDYRVVLDVDERDLGYLREGQSGRLVLEGLPGETLSVEVRAITPVAEVRDGRNVFRVEAHVEGASGRLRPGMAGIAKIEAGEARRIWLYTHRAVRWLHLRLWSWLP